MTAIQTAIGALLDRGGIEPEEAAAALETIMSGEATQAQIGAFLAGMRQYGETPEVVAACWAVMERHAEPIAAGNVVDLCGTGGDGADTFNVSTAAAFVVAGGGSARGQARESRGLLALRLGGPAGGIRERASTWGARRSRR